MTEPLNHKLDVSKIKTLIDVKNLFECMCLSSNASEEHENYELLKEYFTIPNETQELKLELPRKSLEEILQDCNITSNFVIKEGVKEVGYYTFGNGYLRYCMIKKPTAIVRFFMNKLLGFRWIDT